MIAPSPTARMSRTAHRHSARLHHPVVAHGVRGLWYWSCGCGAGGHAGSAMADWRRVLIAALVHESTSPAE